MFPKESTHPSPTIRETPGIGPPHDPPLGATIADFVKDQVSHLVALWSTRSELQPINPTAVVNCSTQQKFSKSTTYAQTCNQQQRQTYMIVCISFELKPIEQLKLVSLISPKMVTRMMMSTDIECV